MKRSIALSKLVPPENDLVWLANYFHASHYGTFKYVMKESGCEVFVRQPHQATELLNVKDLLWVEMCGFYCKKKDLNKMYKKFPRYKRLHERLHSGHES